MPFEPFHSHSHPHPHTHTHTHTHPQSHPHPSPPSAQQHNAQYNQSSVTSDILQAAQNLASVGAGSTISSTLSARTTTSGLDRFSAGSNVNPVGQIAPPSIYASQYSSPALTATSHSASANHPQPFETPRRNRYPEESSYIPSGATNMAQRGPLSPREYSSTGPRISLEQATPDGPPYQGAGQLPGALQPGRPAPMSASAAPTAPTNSQSIAQDQYSTPSRPSTLSFSHSYTRSSPAGFDGSQGYVPFTGTTPSGNDQSQLNSPTSQKYTPQNVGRNVSNTPLGLADIRPRADSSLTEGVPGANPYSYDGANAMPTNSNYLAPWAIYAFDWCKWPAQNHEAGKVAVGSYLEDGHNFVSYV